MNKYTTLAIAAMMVTMAVPATMAEPGNYDDKKSITGPSSVRIQGVGSAGLGICFLDPTFPLACDPAPGATGGLGFANFNTDFLVNPTEEIRFWVEWTGGFFSPLQGGFFILPCTDRDDDGGCFSTDAWDDDYTISFAPPVPCPTSDSCNLNQEPYDDIFGPYGYSNDALVQAAPCDKDTKDCGDPIAAESTFCIEPDTTFKDMFENPNPPQRTPDGVYDDVTMFLGVWAGSLREPGKVGAGISAGTYDVYIEYMGGGCTLAPKP